MNGGVTHSPEECGRDHREEQFEDTLDFEGVNSREVSSEDRRAICLGRVRFVRRSTMEFQGGLDAEAETI